MIMLNHNLHIFLSVAEKSSITEAANELYISQPAVSKAIKNLEQELNIKLFYRDKRKGLILTDVGKNILHFARQMSDLENRMYQSAFQANNFMGGKVKIGSIPILTSAIMAPVLRKFHQKYPDVTVELIEGNSMELRKAVEEHQVELALTASPFGSWDSVVLLQDRMIAVSYQILDEGLITLCQQPEHFIFCKASKETALEMLRAHNINFNKSMIVEQPETVISMVAHQNGIGILSELVANNIPNKLYSYPITPEIKIDIGLIAYDLQDLTPVAMELKRMIMEYADEMDSAV